MRAIKRGARSFVRHIKTNLIVVFLLFVCLAFAISMLSIKLASDAQIQEVKKRIGNYCEIRTSSEYMMKIFEAERKKSTAQRQAEARRMTEEEEFADRVRFLVPENLTDEFSRYEKIETYDKVLETRLEVPKIESTGMTRAFEMRSPGEGGAGSISAGASANRFRFEGNTSGASIPDFASGNKKIADGRLFTYEEYVHAKPVVVIEKSIAEKNDLRVGDKINVKISGKSGAGSTVELKVIGVYQSIEAEDGGEQASRQEFNPAGDTFFAPLSIVQKLNGTPGYVTLGSYYFDSVSSTDAIKSAFKSEFSGVNNDGRYEIATDYSDYESIADSITKAGNSSRIGLASTLGACLFIVLLSMIIIVGHRTKELGILKAIGATNLQVLSQYVVEVMLICLIAVLLAFGSSALMAGKMGDWLLPETKTQNVASLQEPVGTVPRFFQGRSLYKEGSIFGGEVSQSTRELSTLHVTYRGVLFVYAALILVMLCLVGMAIPVVRLVRLEPVRVLRME